MRKTFFQGKSSSAGYARDRMKLLLISERIDCSPQMMKMLRKDIIHSVKKYITIDEEQVCCRFHRSRLFYMPPFLFKRKRTDNI